MDLKILKEIGMTGTESRIYLVLLELGSTLAGEISKKSGLNRTIVYYSLEKLIEKGLVNYVMEANRKVFSPVNPKRLIEILDERRTSVNLALPELLTKFNSIKVESEAEIFRGKKGLKSVFEEILRNNQDYCIMGAEGKFKQILPNYFIHWNNKRIKQNIKAKVLYNEKIRKKREGKIKLVVMKFLPQELEFPSTTQIFGDRVSIMIWDETPYAFVIKSKMVAKSYRNFFDLLWKVAKN